MKPLSLYIHIPFCRRKCDYCAFLSFPPESAEGVDAYVQALKRELWLHRMLLGKRPLRSVYFGGGTPSLLTPVHVGGILDAAQAEFGIEDDAEITVEANPTSQEDASSWLRGVRRAGVNRISIGAQTFEPRGLQVIGRRQEPAAVAAFVAATRDAGFDNFSLDLMYGIPATSLDDWKYDLDSALSLRPPHISIYCLEIHSDTPLGRRAGAGEISDLDESLQAQMYFEALDSIEGAGLSQYEISNFAIPGQESVHNLAYWRSEDYVAVGLGASSHVAGERWWNLLDLESYIATVSSGIPPLAGGERLDSARRLREQAVMRLRLREGCDVRDFSDIFDARHLQELISVFESLGEYLEKLAPSTWRIPRKYLFVSNEIMARIVV